MTTCILVLSGCASQESSTCTLTADELGQIRATALAYLQSERPGASEECEAISGDVVNVAPGKCAIGGAPTGASGCAGSSYVEYSIVFDRETLEPEDIFFKTE